MARLPQPGGDNGTWGEILNEYLSQTLKADGSLKDNSVTSNAIADNAVNAATIQDGSITEAQLDNAVQTKLNANGGSPSWSDVTGKPAVIAAGADQASARAAIGAGTSNLTIGTTSTTAKAGDYAPTKGDVGLGNVDNTSDATKNSSTATLTNKTISGVSNTITNISVGSLAATGTPSGSTYLRGDGSWATPVVSGSSGAGSVSGFPLRLPGEKSVAVAQEVGVVRANASDPAGKKIIVLAESWDKPGILKHIWVACDNSATVDGFLEQGSVIRIYTDDGVDPAISMSLGDFFCLSNRSDIFATPRVGRADRGSGGSAYRYLHMPFQKYLRVEIESLMSSDTAFYGTADFSLIDSFSDLGNQQLAYSIKGQRVANQQVQTPLTVCDFNGSGQVESIVVSFSGADGGDYGVLEGNIKVYVDNEQYPTWTSSGMEDAFNGGWYSIPVGGYPAGRSGNSDQSGANATMYRFFLDDPIFYNSHLKVVVWAGQPRQGSINSATVKLAGYVGVWSTTPQTPNYLAVDTAAAPVADNQMNQAAGTLDSNTWQQDPGRTQIVATGSTFSVPYGSANPDEDTRATLKNVSLPADYWVETRLRITEASHDGQEAHLIMLGATPDAYFGSAVHVQLRRLYQDSWAIMLRDDFGTPMLTYVGGGMDLTNMWVRLAFKKVGSEVTAYYSFNDAPSPWISIGTWQATKAGQGIGIGSWTAGAEFDYLTVRPLKTVSS